MAAKKHRVEQSPRPGWSQRVQQNGGREPASQPCLAFLSVRCVLEELAVRGGAIGDGAIVMTRILGLLRAVAQTCVDDLIAGCVVRHLMSGNFALMVSWVAKAQRTTTLAKAQDGGSSWTWSSLGGRALPHGLEAYLAMCALGVVGADECCDEVEG